MSGKQSPQGWRAVAALFLVTVVIESLAMGHLFSFLPLLLRELAIPEAEIVRRTGFFASLMFVLGLPLIPFWGAWADRYSRRVVIARSAFVETLVFAVLATAQSTFQLGAGILLIGLQLGNTGVMLAALRQVTPPQRVGFALSLVQLGSPIGMAIGPALGGWLMDRELVTLRGLFVVDGLLSCAAGLMITFCFRETRPSMVPEGSIVRQALGAVRLVFVDPIARRLFAVMALFLTARGMVNPILALVVQRVHPDPVGLPGAIGLVVGTAATLGALASPIAGLIGDRAGHRLVLASGVVGGAIALAAMGAARTVHEQAALSALLGAAAATVVSMVYALLALELPEERRSGVLNLAFVPFYIGGMIGPNLAGAIAHGTLDPIFPAAAVCALLALPLALTRKS